MISGRFIALNLFDITFLIFTLFEIRNKMSNKTNWLL